MADVVVDHEGEAPAVKEKFSVSADEYDDSDSDHVRLVDGVESPRLSLARWVKSL